MLLKLKCLVVAVMLTMCECCCWILLQVDQENEQPHDCSSPLTTQAPPLQTLGSFKNAPKSGNFSVRQLSLSVVFQLFLYCAFEIEIFSSLS